jgi:ubiquinone biosynthesis protein COQ9
MQYLETGSLELLGLEANVRYQREIGAHLKSVIAFCSFPSIVRDLTKLMSAFSIYFGGNWIASVESTVPTGDYPL